MEQTKTAFYVFLWAILALIVWAAIDVFLLAFAATLLAIFLYVLGNWTHKITKLPYRLALLLALVVFLGLLTLVFWLYAPTISSQFSLLVEQLPTAFKQLQEQITERFNLPFLQKEFSEELVWNNKKLISQLSTVFSLTVGSLVGFVIFVCVGFYVAFNPERYMRGFMRLIPESKQVKASAILFRLTHALQWWLVGKVIAMITIGILTFVALWLLDVSLALILGLVAALLAFIPYIGSIIAAIPAILLGFAHSPLTALYVTILYLGIHALEGYFITPYIEQKTVSLPPALTIMTQVLFSVLLGALGLALATPLTVIAYALLPKKQYQASAK